MLAKPHVAPNWDGLDLASPRVALVRDQSLNCVQSRCKVVSHPAMAMATGSAHKFGTNGRPVRRCARCRAALRQRQDDPGLSRRRHGRGFSYVDAACAPVRDAPAPSGASARWPFRRRGPTSGSAPRRAAMSRPLAATLAVASNTGTTRCGGRFAIGQIRPDHAFARALPRCAGGWTATSPGRACRAQRWSPSSFGCSKPRSARGQRGIRAREQVVRPDHAAQPARRGGAARRSASRSAASLARHSAWMCATAVCARHARAAGVPANASFSTSTRRERFSRSTPTMSTSTCARRWATTSRPRTSGRGQAQCWRPARCANSRTTRTPTQRPPNAASSRP